MTPEMRKWANNAIAHGGSFIVAFARAICMADDANFAILKPAAEAMMIKYPVYSETRPE